MIERGYITQSHLDEGLSYASERGLQLGQALIECGHISDRQLRRALSWQRTVRTAAAGVMIVLAPLQPMVAFGATQGSVGSTSSATAQITLTIPPRINTSGAKEINFGATAQSRTTKAGDSYVFRHGELVHIGL